MKKYQIILLICLMIVTVFTFYPVLKADFVNFDDMVMVEGNWKINSFTLSNLKSLLFESHFRLYHPVVTLSFAVERALFGKAAYFYHADNLILHLFNVLFVFFIFFSLTKRNFFVSFISAFIFACHPMHVEPVAWVTGRKDVLYAFFFLSSFAVYLKAAEDKNRAKVYYICSLALFILACLSKSMAVTLPAVLILADWFCAKPFNKKSWLKYIPFFAVSAVFAYTTYGGYYFAHEKISHTGYAFFVNFVSAHFNILFYFVKFLIPSNLSIIYPHFFDNSIPPDFILKSPALIYSFAALILFSLKKSKKIFFGFALFLITISPVINVFPTGISPVADRYAYIPFMALGYMLAELAVFLFKAIKLRYVRAVFTGLTAAYFTIICICANAQAATWLNTGTLFDNQIRNYPGRIAQAYATRGLYFYGKGLVKKAERDLCEALVIEPHSSLASFSLAGIRKEQKKYDEAIKLYLKVSLLDPNVTMAYSYLSDIYAALGDEKRALFYIEKALKNKEHPTYVFAFFNAGSFYEKRQDYDKAIEYFLKIKPFFPQDYKVYLKIGAIYEKKGDFESAMQNYIEGFEKSDKKEDILRAAARLCFNERIYGKSESLFKLILLENPGDYSAYDYLGSISALKNDYKKALAFFTMALLIKNDLAESYLHRAIVHLDNKMYYKAKDDFLSASRFGIEIPGFLKDELKENSGIVI